MGLRPYPTECDYYTLVLIFPKKYRPTAIIKDTNRKIRKTEFIYICGSKKGSSNSAVNTGEIWGDVDVSPAQKALCMSCYGFGTKIQTQ